MKVVLFILVYGCLMQASCIFIITEKAEGSALSTIDSLQGHAPPADSVSPVTPRTDSIHTDSIRNKFNTGKSIDTRKVHPSEVVTYAKTLIGVPYRYASTDPKVGFDGSGVITHVFNHFGIIVPRSSRDFTEVGQGIDPSHAKPGDLVLFTGTDSTEKFVGHMGLVVSNTKGNLEFIHSTSGKKYGVTISPLSGYYQSRYVKTVRIFPENS